MIFQAGVENNNEGRSIAWALEHPGCFAYGVNADGALLNLETALSRYAGWILHHDTRTWLSFADSEIEMEVNGSGMCITSTTTWIKSARRMGTA